MPYITVKLMEGRTKEMKAELVESITEAVTKSLKIDPIHVRIELKELEEGTFSVAGKFAEKFNKTQTNVGKGESN